MTTYSGLQGRVYRMLQNVPWTRERRQKDLAIMKLLTKQKFDENPPTAPFSLSELVDLHKDGTSADRYWRLLLKAHKELRGQDYEDKEIYEQKFEIEVLEREPGHFDRSKKLSQLVA